MPEPLRGRPSYWTADASASPSFPSLSGPLVVDVAIVGGGIVGLSAARFLKNLGYTVAVIEALHVGKQTTGRSTAKVTSQHGIIYARLVERFGEEAARRYAEANEWAIGRIESLCREHGVDCDFERQPAYVYARAAEKRETIEDEVRASSGLGLPASLETDLGLPYPVAAAVRFSDQAQFHPYKYCLGLAQTIPGGGSHVFEETRVTSVNSDSVETDAGPVHAAHVIVATHLPLNEIGLFFARAFPYAHPMVAGPVDPARVPEGMFISMDSPTHSFRTHRKNGETNLVAVGGAFKPGHPQELEERFADLEAFVRDAFGVQAEHRWTNMEYEAEDGVPFIGRSALAGGGVFIATGFNAWGITGGTVAGEVLANTIAERPTPWAEVFDPSRLKPLEGGQKLVKENLEAGKHLAKGWMTSRPKSADELAAGEAAVIDVKGRLVAAYRDTDGRLHAVSAACTHLGCIVGWNPEELTWDCPCHGSRFSATGAVIHGPTVAPLEEEATEFAEAPPRSASRP